MKLNRIFNTLPYSISFFGIAAIVYGLQLIPTTGVFLMFVAGPFWSVFLINTGFLGVGIEAVVGRIHRAWLLLPFAWFCGYTVFAYLDHLEVAQIRTRLESHNAKVHVPFDADTDKLVVERLQDANYLVADYRIPIVFAAGKGPQRSNTHAVRLAGKDFCDLIRRTRTPAFSEAGIHTAAIRDPLDGRRFRVESKDHCLLSVPNDLKNFEIKVEVSSSDQRENGIPTKLTELRLSLPGQENQTLLFAEVQPLSWWPKPVIGCALVSSRPSWECIHTFLREKEVLGAQPDRPYRIVPDLIANALGLDFVKPGDRSPLPSEQLQQVIEKALSRAETASKN